MLQSKNSVRLPGQQLGSQTLFFGNFVHGTICEIPIFRFGVYDDNDKLLGQRVLPFNDLMMGYRHIALRTEGNFPMALPMLFVQIDVKEWLAL